MKVTLICPSIHKPGIQKISPFWLPPLSLATIASLSPKDIEIKIVDENVEEINWEEKTDLVGISFLTSQADRAYHISAKFRKRNIPVIMGGYHPSALPEEAKLYADSVVIGEAEEIWMNLLDDFRNGNLKPLYKHEDYPDLSDIPLPRRDLLKKERYLTTNTIQTSKGCPYACEFCNISSFFGRKYRTKPIDSIINEIKSLKKADKNIFFFVDDEITGNIKRAKDLFKALIPLNISWWSQATLTNLTKDRELLDLARESGCIVIIVGMESLSEQNLKAMNKNHNSTDKFEDQIAMIQDHGIFLNPSFTFGNDYDDESVFDTTYDFLEKNGIILATFNILTPLPGTALFNRLISEDRILTKDWSLYDMGHCVFQPKRMSKENLESGFHSLLNRFYSFESIKKRLAGVPQDKKSLMFGWNLGYKKLLDTFGVLM
jgi:radical SAM superfamily enzyme YgiQ (UPF0313 family)